MGVPSSAIKVANVTDIATGAVFRVPVTARRLAGGAAGSGGVSFTVVANLGKTVTAASVADKQAALLSNFNSSSPAFGRIKSDVAAAAGVPAASLVAVPPNPAAITLGGSAAGLTPPVIFVNGGAAQDAGTAEGAGAGIGILIVGIGVALYCWRSYVVHGALPCQRNRKREIFELKQQATREAEARMQADTEDATLVNPAATAGRAR